jgi:hypothetical protein
MGIIRKGDPLPNPPSPQGGGNLLTRVAWGEVAPFVRAADHLMDSSRRPRPGS